MKPSNAQGVKRNFAGLEKQGDGSQLELIGAGASKSLSTRAGAGQTLRHRTVVRIFLRCFPLATPPPSSSEPPACAKHAPSGISRAGVVPDPLDSSRTHRKPPIACSRNSTEKRSPKDHDQGSNSRCLRQRPGRGGPQGRTRRGGGNRPVVRLSGRPPSPVRDTHQFWGTHSTDLHRSGPPGKS